MLADREIRLVDHQLVVAAALLAAIDVEPRRAGHVHLGLVDHLLELCQPLRAACGRLRDGAFATTRRLAIEISRFGVEVIKDPHRFLAVEGQVPEVDFVENGYLFLATDAGLATLEHNHAVQRALDVPVALLDRSELGARFAQQADQ